MPDRYSQRDIKEIFKRFMSVVGARPAQHYGDVGGWQLNYAPIYGGYNIEEIMNSAGGITHPIWEGRMKPSQLVEAMLFTMRTIEYMKMR